jgi:hypothetical protein
METKPRTGILEIPAPTMTVRADGSYRLESVCVLDGVEHLLFFEVKGVPPVNRVEPFLAMLLAPAQKLGLDIVVHAPVSPVLLANLEKIQAQFVAWWPDEFRQVRISTDGVARMTPAAEQPRGGCCCFSMGVDAFYSTLTHLDKISYLVHAHGFDTDLDATDLIQRISAQVQKAAGELGKRAIEVASNGREITTPILWWGYQGGGFLGAVALIISPVVDKLIIPQHWSAEQDHPFCIHPAIDPFWSTETITVESDAMLARIDKVKALATSPIALKYLRVCWDSRCVGYNCGACPKCVRTQIALRIFRASVPPGHFLYKLNLHHVAFKPDQTDEERMWYQEMLEALDAQPHRDPLLRWALKTAIAGGHSRGFWKPIRTVVRQVKRLTGRPSTPSS